MLLWVLEIILLLTALFVVQIPLRKKGRPVWRVTVFMIKVLLIPAAALFFVAIESPLAYRRSDVFAAAYIVLFSDVCASIVEYVIRKLKGSRGTETEKSACRLKLLSILSVVFCLCIFIYGFVNAGHVKEKRHTWTAEGVTQAHTFAFAADLHVESARSMENVKEFCRQVNDAAPEFVILGGDVTDELTSYDDMRETYRLLSEIEAPVFFIYGNHDRQPDASYFDGRTYSDEQLEEAIREAGITILSDQFLKVADDLTLLGREDISMEGKRTDWSDLIDPFQGTGALVVADHQPYDEEQLVEERSAVQLSGHTHAGQLWPLQIVYRMMGLPAYGVFEKPGTLLYVSAGVGVWSMPLRTEANCEWELITLVP
ncbi:MAG: metallophosphoesterase [Firmicutes bacterium]|nr:metallophosphoesterase [Bacillota bacterium]